MSRLLGLKDSLSGVFRSKKTKKKREHNGKEPSLASTTSTPTTTRPPSSIPEPSLNPLLPRYTQLFSAGAQNGSPSPKPQHHQPTTAAIPPGPSSTTSANTPEPGSDLWAEAYLDFETRNPPLAAGFTKHLNTFHHGGSATTSDSLLSDISFAEPLVLQLLADREKKQWRVPLLEKDINIRAEIEKLTKFCLWTDQVVKQTMSAQPYAALAWSGVSIILPLLTSGKIQHEAMLSGLGYVSKLQLYWRIYEDGHPQDQISADIRDSIVKLYSHIVEYHALVIHHLSSDQLIRTWHKIADLNDWEGRKSTIADMDAHCSRLVSDEDKVRIQRETDTQLKEMQESREILDDIRQKLKTQVEEAQERFNDEKEAALLRSLATDYEHYKNVNPPRVDGTCEWLFGDKDFEKWKRSEKSSLLWISAGPGCGKSVLTRCLIDEERLSPNITTSNVCYFFFQTGVEGRTESCDAMAAILHQLFTKDASGELIKLGLPSHKSHGDKLKRNFAELWRVLMSCADSSVAGEIICVFDALDECSEESRETLLNAIDDYLALGGHRTKLKFLITSRPYEDLEGAFKKYTERSSFMRVDGDEKIEEIGKEINFVIDLKVQEFAGDFSESDRQAICERLKAMENRTYLWLHLTFDIIKKRRGAFSKASRIQDLLSSVPSKISDAYETILNYNPEEDRDITRALLHLILAAKRPLTLKEANFALTMATSEKKMTAHWAIEDELWPEASFKSVIRSLSGLFITVCDSKLSFIHLTAREFLTDDKKKEIWHGSFTLIDSHASMSSLCIQYLSILDIGSLKEPAAILVKNFGFFKYAIAYWPSHFNLQGTRRSPEDNNKARKLCDVSEGRGARLRKLYYSTETFGQAMDELEDCTELELACGLGLTPLVSHLLDDVDKESPEFEQLYARILALAANDGHAKIAKLVIQSTTNTEIHQKYDSTAFTVAIMGQEMETMQAIVEASPEIHGVEEEGVNFALCTGDKALVGFVIDHFGESIHLTEYAIQMAMSNQDHAADVVDLLLRTFGKEFKLSHLLVETAAGNMRWGRQLMALLLEKRWAEVELTDGVLKEACRNMISGKEIIALFIEKRDLVVTEDLLIWTAHNYGCGVELMKFLLDQGGDKIALSDELIASTIRNIRFGDIMLQLVRDRCEREEPIPASSLEIAAANIGCGPKLMALLLDAVPSPLSDKVVTLSVGNKEKGKELLDILLQKRPDQVIVTDELLSLEVKDRNSSDEIVAMLKEKRERDDNVGRGRGGSTAVATAEPMTPEASKN